ncbi:protein-serine/threonine phosphatase [Ranunculus cassubicifolius]
MEIIEPNTCIRGCCTSSTIPLHLNPSSYTLISPIAKGSESIVYQAILNGVKVAAKKPILSTSQDIDRFHRELQLQCKLDHPGIATLIAAHAKPPNYMFFLELFESGSLDHKIHVEEWVPGILQAVSIIFELAQALQYLHHLGIVHRDVKPANILLDRDLSPHLADFGLAEYKKNLRDNSVENWKPTGKPTGGFHKKNMVGTLIYMAPEILKKEIQSEKSDVYSFGISINELLTGVVPYTDLRAEAQAHTVLEMNYTEQQLTAAVVSQGLRPVLASPQCGAPDTLLSLIQRCWDGNPLNRPSFDDIVAELNPIVEFLKRTQTVKIPVEPSVLLTEHSDIQTYKETVNWSSQGELLVKRSSLVDSTSRIWSNSTENSSSYNPILSSGSFSTCGKRETMEDTHFLMPRMGNEKDVHLFGIFDGHRGAAAAQFSACALPGFLKHSQSAISPSDALSQAFVKTDVAFRSELTLQHNSKRLMQKDRYPGCTAIVAMIIKDALFIANAGDCRTVLCRGGHVIALSQDHVASRIEERERVVRAGGHVRWQVDTWRVGPAALQVTRSIGDDDLKPAVTAEPEITETILTFEDEFIVMASDGLWDVVSNDEVVSIIRDTVKEPGMCSKRLATEAAERGSKDNITVIVVFLRPVSTAERVY